MDIRKTPDELAASALTGYVTTHCRNCGMGWTRIGDTGKAMTVCLLDREPVWVDMTSCDRYELREAEALPVPSAA